MALCTLSPKPDCGKLSFRKSLKQPLSAYDGPLKDKTVGSNINEASSGGGDSGIPLFDAKGKLAGTTSGALPWVSEDGTRVYRSFYVNLLADPNKEFIKLALAENPANVGPSVGSSSGTQQSSGSSGSNKPNSGSTSGGSSTQCSNGVCTSGSAGSSMSQKTNPDGTVTSCVDGKCTTR